MNREQAVKLLQDFEGFKENYIANMTALMNIPAFVITEEKITKYMSMYTGQLMKLKVKYEITDEEINGI